MFRLPVMNPWALLAIVTALGSALAYAYHLGAEHTRNAVAAERLAEQESISAGFQAAMQRARTLVTELAKERAKKRVEYRIVREEVPSVTTVYVPEPDADPVPLPGCTFTRGFVRVWNDALDLSLPDAAGRAPSRPTLTDPAGFADLEPSELGQTDILTNHVDNAEVCGGVRLQLDGLIRWHREQASQGRD